MLSVIDGLLPIIPFWCFLAHRQLPRIGTSIAEGRWLS